MTSTTWWLQLCDSVAATFVLPATRMARGHGSLLGIASTLSFATILVLYGLVRTVGQIKVGPERGPLGVAIDGPRRRRSRRLGWLERWYVAHSRAGTHTGFCLLLELELKHSSGLLFTNVTEVAVVQTCGQVSRRFAWLQCRVRRNGVAGVDSRQSLSQQALNGGGGGGGAVWGDDLYVEHVVDNNDEPCLPSIRTVALDESDWTLESRGSKLHQILQDESIKEWHDEDPSQPLWRVTLVHCQKGDKDSPQPATNGTHFALILSFHHLITDGMGALQVARAIVEIGGGMDRETDGPSRSVKDPPELPQPMEDVMDTTPRLSHLLLPIFMDRCPRLASMILPSYWKGNSCHCSAVAAEDRSTCMVCIQLVSSSSQLAALCRYGANHGHLSVNTILTAALLRSLAQVAHTNDTDPVHFAIEVAADERRRRVAADIPYNQLGTYVTGPKVHATVRPNKDGIVTIGRSFAHRLAKALAVTPYHIGLLPFINGDWIEWSRQKCKSSIPNGVRDSLSLSFLTNVDRSLVVAASDSQWNVRHVWLAQGCRGHGPAVRASVAGTEDYINVTLAAFPHAVSTEKLQRIALAWKQELATIHGG
jgi:hypothetical protein